MCRRSCGKVVEHGGRVLRRAACGKNVVCKSEVGEVRVGVVFGNFDSVIKPLPLFCHGFHDVL